MPDRAHLVADVEVGAPAQRVWDLLVDWARHDEWMLGTHMESTTGDGASVGAELVAVTGRGRLSFTDSMRITTWEPPRRCAIVHTGRLVRGEGVFEVVPVPGDRTRVIWTERLDLPLGALGRIGWVVARPVARAGLLVSLRRLARVAERG